MRIYRYIYRGISSKLTLLILMLYAALQAQAQNDPQYAQYWAMPVFYNPGYAGSTEFIRIRGGVNLQWIGIKNAPQSFNLNADMPFQIGKKHRLGIGINGMQESIGLFQNLLVGAQLAYQFNALKGTFAVGIQPAYYNSKFKGSEVSIPEGDDYHQSNDEAIPNQDVTGNAFDLSAGIRYTHKYFSIGVSALHILEPKITLDKEGDNSQTTTEADQFQTTLPRQMYFTADGNIPLKNSLFSLQPSLLLRTDFSYFSAEITARATYNRFISVGVGYRWKDALSVMIAAEFKNFFLGYAYSYPFSPVNRASSGSHEIVVGYMVKLNLDKKNKNKQRSIRIM